MVDREWYLGGCGLDYTVCRGGSNRNSARFDTGAIQHVTQADASPPGISHGPVLPLSAGHPRLEETAGIARALTDRHEFDARHRQQISER